VVSHISRKTSEIRATRPWLPVRAFVAGGDTRSTPISIQGRIDLKSH
jgi:hypothetical protein